jgi:dephospho-CoA kinase
MNAVKVVGVTGLTRSGKSTLCEYIKKQGKKVIDVDKFAHTLYKKETPLSKKLVREYGKTILKKSGVIDRDVLREIVFKSKKSYKNFTSIVYPVMNRELLKKIKSFHKPRTTNHKSLVFLDMAVLFESGFYKNVDCIVFVSANSKNIKSRAKDVRNLEKYEKITAFQKLFAVSKKIALSTYIIYNDKSKRDLFRKVAMILKKL